MEWNVVVTVDQDFELAGRSFHIRMHHRGFREELSSGAEERDLDAHPILNPD